MLTNKASISAVFKSLNAAFNNALRGVAPTWIQYATKIPSNTSVEEYDWVSAFPRMRVWLGDKQVSQLKASNYTVKNKKYESTIEIKEDDLDDDKLGAYKAQATGAGISAAELPDMIAAEMLDAVFDTICWDGQYMVDTDHPITDFANDSTTTYSNDGGTTALSATTITGAQNSIGAALSAMGGQKSDEGRPLGIEGNLLIVPPALRETANLLATSARLFDGVTNPYKGLFKVLVNKWLTSTTAWFVIDDTLPVKPIIWQERRAAHTVQDDGDKFMKGVLHWGAEARGVGAYGLPQGIYGSAGA